MSSQSFHCVLVLALFSSGDAAILSISKPLRITNASILLADSHAGRYTNCKIAKDGFPTVAFNDEHQGGAGVVHCTNAECSAFSRYTVNPSSDSNNARFMNMKIGADGLPVLSYSHDNAAIVLAKCHDVACKASSTVNVTSGNHKYEYSELLLRQNDGTALVAYTDASIGLVAASCSDFTCSKYKTITIDPGKGNGRYPGVVEDAQGIPTFASCSNNSVRVSRCSDRQCTSVHTKVVASGGYFRYTAMTLGRDGFVVLIYVDEDGPLHVVHCADAECNVFTDAVVEDLGKGVDGVFPEIDISPIDGKAVMTYYKDWSALGGGSLQLSQCMDVECSKVLTQTVAKGAFGFGRDSSIAFASGGRVFVSYLDYNGGDNKHTRLAMLSYV